MNVVIILLYKNNIIKKIVLLIYNISTMDKIIIQ